ncbi:MAG: carboxymuconolactone decarboxylase family protein [Solirubrobacterales bacterium]|nr:carboxymuconolactone decarboxylase family protein [Solirubrobacterales bacterium]
MRPQSLEHGYGLGPKMLFRFIRLVTRQPVPDAAKITFYRPDFYGTYSKKLTHEAMRGRSEWSVGDRELMAAYISKVNDCPFCVGAHAATAAGAYREPQRVAAVLTDLDCAPIEDGLRATLRMLGNLAREGSLSVDDMRTVLSAGVSHQQIEDALAVSFAFNTTDRLANAFAFEILTQAGFEAGAKYLLKRGYR